MPRIEQWYSDQSELAAKEMNSNYMKLKKFGPHFSIHLDRNVEMAHGMPDLYSTEPLLFTPQRLSFPHVMSVVWFYTVWACSFDKL